MVQFRSRIALLDIGFSRSPNHPASQRGRFTIRDERQRGYVLLVLLLFVALLSIGSLAVMRNLEFQIKRDREEEMVHRGVQYSRAIKRYYKKFGRYPTRVEELENSNNIRFLRKRYKDPLNRDKATGKEKDFKFLHLTDVQMSFNAAQRGMTAVTDMANQQAGAPGALNPAAAAPTGAGPGAIGGTQSQQGQQAPGQEGATDQNDSANPDQQGSGPAATPPPPQPLLQQAGPNGAPQVFGGGAIVGVASFNKEKTIREFNKKNHYNQWQFMYDPSTDRGGLLMTPNQPPLQGAAQNVQQGQNGENGPPGTPIQNQNGFGSSFGNGMNPTPQPPTSEPTNQQ
jgi:type II secretory pathway pseudopilin PulG